MLDALVIATVLPLTALVFGTSALGAEIEDGTAGLPAHQARRAVADRPREDRRGRGGHDRAGFAPGGAGVRNRPRGR